MVRCKLKLTEVHHVSWSKAGKRLVFEAQYDQSIPEDQRFFESSPNAKFDIFIDNPTAVAFFQLGECYYFDASAVQAAAQQTVGTTQAAGTDSDSAAASPPQASS